MNSRETEKDLIIYDDKGDPQAFFLDPRLYNFETLRQIVRLQMYRRDFPTQIVIIPPSKKDIESNFEPKIISAQTLYEASSLRGAQRFTFIADTAIAMRRGTKVMIERVSPKTTKSTG